MDDIGRLLEESIDAIHRQNTRRPIHCLCGCGVTYLNAAEYFRHRHPSGRRR
jgi:hypothetical protein